jgi:hypothetical protein
MSTQNDPGKSNSTDVGGAGDQHNDWGHSDVGEGDKPAVFQLEDVLGSDAGVSAEELTKLQSELGEDEGPAGG